MNQTTNYKLNLPEGRDVVDIDVLNGNFSSLDGLIKEAMEQISTVDDSLDSTNSSLQSAINDCKPITGSYTGNSASSRSISLGFKPAVVIVFEEQGPCGIARNGMAMPGWSTENSYGTLLSVNSSGFTVYHESNSRRLTNLNGVSYMYAAWR